MIDFLKTETVHFVKSVKLVSVYVKLLKPLEPKASETEPGFDIANTLTDLKVAGHPRHIVVDPYSCAVLNIPHRMIECRYLSTHLQDST